MLGHKLYTDAGLLRMINIGLKLPYLRKLANIAFHLLDQPVHLLVGGINWQRRIHLQARFLTLREVGTMLYILHKQTQSSTQRRVNIRSYIFFIALTSYRTIIPFRPARIRFDTFRKKKNRQPKSQD